jgi:hypothetical protein
VQACPPLRAFPFQPTQSDGMVLGGTLQFLVAQKFCLPQPRATFLAALDAQAHVSVNPMVAIEPKKRDASELLLSLRSTSSLTGAEYLRYNLLCHSDLLPTATLLVQHGRVPLSDLIPSSTRKALAAHVTGLGSGGGGGAGGGGRGVKGKGKARDTAGNPARRGGGAGGGGGICSGEGEDVNGDCLALISCLLYGGVLALLWTAGGEEDRAGGTGGGDGGQEGGRGSGQGGGRVGQGGSGGAHVSSGGGLGKRAR